MPRRWREPNQPSGKHPRAARPGALFRSSLRLGVFAAQGERASGPDPEALAAADVTPSVRAGVPGDRRPARRRKHGRQGRQAGRQRRRPRQADLPRPPRRGGESAQGALSTGPSRPRPRPVSSAASLLADAGPSGCACRAGSLNRRALNRWTDANCCHRSSRRADLQTLTDEQLQALTQEIRDELVRVLTTRPAHFASNLGVVELCLALHLTFDFSQGPPHLGHRPPDLPAQAHHRPLRAVPHHPHQGRADGLPATRRESHYDLFMTGHAGCSVSTVSGLKAGDDLLGRKDRHAVAVDRRRCVPLRHRLRGAQQHRRDGPERRWSSSTTTRCPSARGPAAWRKYLDQCRMTGFYQGSKQRLNQLLAEDPARRRHGALGARAVPRRAEGLLQGRHALRGAGLPLLRPGRRPRPARRCAKILKRSEGRSKARCCCTSSPNKGHGVPQAAEDPVTYHTPPVFEKVGPDRADRVAQEGRGEGVHRRGQRRHPPGDAGRPEGHRHDRGDVPGEQARKGPRATSPTASSTSASARAHAVAFAAGMAKAGLRPIVDIYSPSCSAASTRSSRKWPAEPAGHVLPRPRRPDRPGRPDAPRRVRHPVHAALPEHGRSWPPATKLDVAPMLRVRAGAHGPISMRYPKANLEKVERRAPSPIELGKAEVHRMGRATACFVAFGTLLLDLRQGGREAARGGPRRRRHQRPLRQAARPGHDPAGGRRRAAGRDGGRRHARRRLRQRGAGGGERRRAGHAQRRAAAASRTASSSTASATNCSPTSG